MDIFLMLKSWFLVYDSCVFDLKLMFDNVVLFGFYVVNW